MDLCAFWFFFCIFVNMMFFHIEIKHIKSNFQYWGRNNGVNWNLIQSNLPPLVNTQWKRFIEGKNKDTRPKKAKDAKDANESSITSIESSDSEEWVEEELVTVGTESHSTSQSGGITTTTFAAVKDSTGNTRELYILLDIQDVVAVYLVIII